MAQQHQIGEVWKDPQPFVKGKPWYVQFRGFREGFVRKCDALKMADIARQLEDARIV